LPVDDPDRRDIENNRNHGARLSGPWIFGLVWRHQLEGKEVLERRYFVVERRNRQTRFPIIQRELAIGTWVWSDEWAAYRCLNASGFEHDTVNHQHNFLNPESGVNTQTVECLWGT